MDKGLEKIRNLEQKLKDLELKEINIDENFENLECEYAKINSHINLLHESLCSLHTSKNIILENPKYLKKYKKDTICRIIYGIIMLNLLAIGLCATTIGLVIPVLIATTLVITPGAIVFGIRDYKKEKKNRTKNNLNEIESKIEITTQDLNTSKDKLNELSNEILKLEEDNIDLKNEKENILEEKNIIETIRKEVIKQFCNDNKDLEKLLNSSYDKHITKEKGIQKIKK